MTYQTEIAELDLQQLDRVVGGESRDPLSGGAGDDVLIGGEPTDPVANGGYIRIKKLNSGG